MAVNQQSGKVPPGQYDAFRSNGFPTYYGEIKTTWQADIVEAGIIFSFCILALAFFFIMPGFHGKQVNSDTSYRYSSLCVLIQLAQGIVAQKQSIVLFTFYRYMYTAGNLKVKM